MKNNNLLSAKLMLIFSMLIFGTIGIFKKSIPLPSGSVAMFRGIIGAVFLGFLILITRKKLNFHLIKKHIWLLIISGAFIGFNWILLFESYNYTSVSTATLCYYMAPVFVIFASPIFLKEKLTLKQLICSLFSILGMMFVSGIFEIGFKNLFELIGVFLALSAALLYAGVIIMNKKMTEVRDYEKTLFQLTSAGITIIPYTIFFENIELNKIDIKTVILILVLGLVHTGLAYTLYFASLKTVKAQTVAIYSYIDPIFAVLLSVIVLKGKMSVFEIIGCVIILSATLISEIDFNLKKVRSN